MRNFLRENQMLLSALLIFLAVIVYCLFNRYYAICYNDPVHGSGSQYVVDKFSGEMFYNGTVKPRAK